MRLLPPALIPLSLWDKTIESLHLPPSLSKAYIAHVDNLGLRDIGTTRPADGGPVGGLSKESTDQHLAQCFDGSVARAMLAVLDPKSEGGKASNTFIKSMAGSTLALTDAPCGAGAAAMAFLSTIAELRANEVLPRHPLEVKFVGGELSSHAVDHAKKMFSDIQPELEAQAIFLDLKFIKWDVLDKVSTADLVKESAVHGASCSSKLLVIANFNGFLVKESKRKEALPQIEELLRYASGEQSLAVWIEPDMNRSAAIGGLFSWLFKQFDTVWKKFAKIDPTATSAEPVFRTAAKFSLPLQPTDFARVSLAVMPIDLTRSTSK